ncbi:type VI secretion protein [Burkholderia pyrrocinia]|uniref:DUF4150 domain-containing protein n=1 Tax=Burkholderia stagnalis TaxID=1503054 RepID=UPI00075E5CC5|nr:DUF4150 domain-containing protein [Burkholderia stagnalis]KVN35060.1 type VI secretion protein [Burkholderia pyrrocinia]WGS47486.1 DUF4150 domain-containing protein [Burkholderia sp. JSH-S8]
MAIAPSDVCKTPPLAIPIPYPNIANKPEAVPNVPTIIYCGSPVHNKNTIIPVTHSDEPGSMGGVASGTVAALSINVTCSTLVIIQGAGQTRLTDSNATNNHNTIGTTVVPSQTIVLILR